MCVHSWTQFDIYRIKAIMIIILKIYWGPDPLAGSRRFTLDTIHSKTINMTKTFPLRPFNHLRSFPDGANVSFTSFLCLRHTATNLRYHMSHWGNQWSQIVNGFNRLMAVGVCLVCSRWLDCSSGNSHALNSGRIGHQTHFGRNLVLPFPGQMASVEWVKEKMKTVLGAKMAINLCRGCSPDVRKIV